MNGQPLTNSSNSANGTPSSSYPASLSSQSSRDPSPATRKPTMEPHNHVISQPNHWPKDKNSALKASVMDGSSPQQTPQIQQKVFVPPMPVCPPVSSSQTQADNSESISPLTTGAMIYQQATFPSLSQQAPTSSQNSYRFPNPSSVSQPSSTLVHNNHLPHVNSSVGQISSPNQPYSVSHVVDPPRSTKSPLVQSSNQLFAQSTTTSASHYSNQYVKPIPTSFQQQQNQMVINPSKVAGQLTQSTPSHQLPTSQTENQPHNLFTRSPMHVFPPLHQMSQTPRQVFQPPSHISQPSSQVSNPSVQVSQSSSQFPHSSNQFSQKVSQFPPPSSQFSEPSKQISQSYQFSQPSKVPQSPPEFSQPIQGLSSQPLQQKSNISHLPNQNSQSSSFSQSSHTSKFFNQTSQLHSQYTNQGYKLPNQHLNQFSSIPNESFHSQNQFSQSALSDPITQPPRPNQITQPPNVYPEPPGKTLPQTQCINSTINSQHQYTQPQQPQQQHLPNQYNKRYPQLPGFQHQPSAVDGLSPHLASMSIQQGFNKLWGMDTVDLLKSRDLLPREKLEPPAIRLQHELYESANCSPEIFRCTLTKIPETKSLLDKSRLPLGVLIHPFKDLNQLSVIQCTVIVRCRMCRTYINPFVYFVDNKRWKCNLCFRVNELPDEFQFDPMTKTYGDPSRRPEIKSATIEFIAPSEYMVRPPQPAVYVFVLDVSRLACECGYLDVVCRTLQAEIDNLPGDARSSVAFITFDSSVHFYSLTEGQGQPHQMVVVDIDDMFLPTPENLLVNLNDCRDLIRDLLQELPNKYKESYDTHSALGAALQAAYKLLAATGGRVTVFQSCLPNVGPGALTPREDPAQRAGDNPPHLNPSTDFYKKLALDCSGQQIAVDLFLVNSQYLDLATLSGISRFSGGCIHHIPLFRSDKPLLVETLERIFQRYLTRKIGFESVMRIRCTRGLSIHTFHGNFFVRSTDLLSLPNANPDAGFGMQVTIDENLAEIQNICFQAALLYTSSRGERRIRVHTLCLPVASNLSDVMYSADQQCIAGLLAKMAVDRAIQSSLMDAREAFVNVVADILTSYKLTQSSSDAGCLLAPTNLRLLPLYILALLKHVAFRVGQSTRLDDRVFAMCQMKSLPLTFLIQSVYPDLYPLLNIEQQPEINVGDQSVPQPPRLQLSSERIDSHGLFLLDDGATLLLYVGHNLDPVTCQAVFNVPHFSAIPQELYSLPELDNSMSEALRSFISYLQNEKPYSIPLQIIRDDSHYRVKFLERMIEDKNESGTSYYEFLQRVKTIMK